MAISQECEVWIYKQRSLSLRGEPVKKVWLCDVREGEASVGCLIRSISLNSVLRKFKVVEKADKRCPTGCWLSWADTNSHYALRSSVLRPAKGQLPHRSMPTHSLTHRVQWLCHVAMIQHISTVETERCPAQTEASVELWHCCSWRKRLLPCKQNWLKVRINIQFPIVQTATRPWDTAARAQCIDEMKVRYHGHCEGEWLNQWGTSACTNLYQKDKEG